MTYFSVFGDYNLLTNKEKREEMTVYGDLLFLINFSMDFLCFYILCLLLHTRLPLLRACISSAVGGVYSVASLFMSTGKGIAVLLDILCCVFMCALVFFKRGGTFKIIKATVLYFFVSMALGGAMTGLFYLLNGSGMFSEANAEGNGITSWVFALLAVSGGGITMVWGRFFRSSNERAELLLELENEGKRVRIKALADSGNLMSDPISGRGVIIVTLKSSRELIPKDMYPAFESISNLDGLSVASISKIRLIPSSTIMGEGVLPAIRIKRTRIISKGKEKELDALIAFVNKDDLSGYDAIIPSAVIT